MSRDFQARVVMRFESGPRILRVDWRARRAGHLGAGNFDQFSVESERAKQVGRADEAQNRRREVSPVLGRRAPSGPRPAKYLYRFA